MKPTVQFGLLLSVAAGCLFPLLSASPFLVVLLPGGLPLGTLLAAGFFAALGVAGVPLAPPGGHARRLAWICAALACAWLPVSMLLAGNAALNFASPWGDLWLWFSGCLVLLALASMAVGVGARFLAYRAARGGSRHPV